MNRKVKYRAWDKENKRMIEWNEEFFSDMSPVTNWGNSIDYDNMDLMQYTGLKDKNGVEIYEGDLLQEARNSRGNVYTVVFYDSRYCLEYKFTRKYQGEEWEETNHMPIHRDSYVVIGNIYENK